jgi:hypothetical protein
MQGLCQPWMPGSAKDFDAPCPHRSKKLFRRVACAAVMPIGPSCAGMITQLPGHLGPLPIVELVFMSCSNLKLGQL